MNTASRFLLTAAVALPLLALSAQAAGSHAQPLQKSASFGGYTANIYFDPESNTKDAYFEILKNHKPVYRHQATENGERFNIGTFYDDDRDAKLVTMGRDITGDGQPDLVISEWSGGANCCLTLHIFEIGQQFRKIGDIDAAFGDQGPHFVKLGGGPGLQVKVYDWTFANWHADFADSPAPRLILEYRQGQYRVASHLMCTPVSGIDGLAARVEKVRGQSQNLRAGSWPDAEIPPQLWGTMLDLIYSCHRLTAWQFVDTVWPKKIKGRERFIDDFTAQLKKSPYWKSVSQLGS